MRFLTILLSLVLLHLMVNSQIQVKSYEPAKVTVTPPVIDGKLNEGEWDASHWASDFVQQKPLEGQPASQKTSFCIMYDNDHIYVAFRMQETDPLKISRRLSRRDEVEGDLAGIQFDSYYDKTTAFFFFVTAAGVKADGIVSDAGNGEDFSWDAMWNAATSVDANGWTAELKIPLSQLRFSKAGHYSWGLQVLRYMKRYDEVDIWQPIPRDAPTWVSNFGTLTGLDGIAPKRQIELMPYGVASAERYKADPENPFSTGKSSELSAGLDGKIGITNNMILDFTINPDFGQVEADPSEVNLTAFESYFEEKRPFFVEGRNILSFGVTPGDNDRSSDNLFYSRRIGRSPQRDLSAFDYADVPKNTTILGAFKLTGKTRNGWSVGTLESVTAREFARVISQKIDQRIEAEPLTNYFINRVQKDFNQGTTRIGGMFTAVNRNSNDACTQLLHRSAYSGGIDFSHTWKDRTYYLNLKTLFSYVAGDSLTLQETQKSSARYFQRPDADYVHFDPTRTSLAGHAGIVEFGKAGKGHWRYTTWINWRSPGFEINDAGFQRRTDDIFQVIWVGYRYYKPFSIFKEISLNFNQWSGWDFGLTNTYSGGNINVHAAFKNMWNLSAGANRDMIGRSNGELRGGPSMLMPGGFNFWGYLSTDPSRKFSAGINANRYASDDASGHFYSFGLDLTWAPANAVNVSLMPFYNSNATLLQYVDETSMLGEPRYIFASLSQQTLGIPVRINIGLSPDLTVQYYGQPFISAGKYSDYKMITHPDAGLFTDRFVTFNEQQISYSADDELFSIDENTDGSADYSFYKPDFNAFYFLSNLVIRWEYRPGSSVYLVWSQNRSDGLSIGQFRPGPDLDHLTTIYPHNVFLIKVSYRLGL